MSEKVYCIFTFYSIHYALKLEMSCRNENVPGKLIPVPRSISASCGTAFRGEMTDREKIAQIAKKDGVEIETVVEYRVTEQKSILNKMFNFKK